ncbi:MAG: TraR/DksA C4-type zinc finger protein [bacterium]|nr:TraR/DksA C4-type zinc finger protein [bacterium]
MVKVNSTKNVLKFPKKLLSAIGDFLGARLRQLEHRRRTISEDDPFQDGRVDSLASPDTDAAEQFGHARSEALKRELDRKMIQTRKALARVKIGSYGICEECGEMIDTDRLMIYPEATLCVSCERKRERR